MLTLGLSVPVAETAAATPNLAITIQGGVLAISVPSASVDLGTAANTVGGTSITSSLGIVAVSDARSGVLGWVASVISTAFTPTAGPTIAASFVGYSVGTITKVGTATDTVTNQTNLTGVVPVVTATAVSGDNSASWNPTISVAVAQGTLAGVYTATITHSVV
jgi:hypothetical protein